MERVELVGVGLRRRHAMRAMLDLGSFHSLALTLHAMCGRRAHWRAALSAPSLTLPPIHATISAPFPRRGRSEPGKEFGV